MNRSRSQWMLSTLAGVILLLAPVSAFPQSCALCYTQAASSGSRMIQALKSGILILIAPPTVGSLGVMVVLYRKRNQVRRTDSDDDSGKDPDADLQNDWQKNDSRNNHRRNNDRRNNDW
jgi:hypothetical protein